jgi:hypothetical protein
MGKDYYSILGVPKTADDAELKKGSARHDCVVVCASRSCLPTPRICSIPKAGDEVAPGMCTGSVVRLLLTDMNPAAYSQDKNKDNLVQSEQKFKEVSEAYEVRHVWSRQPHVDMLACRSCEMSFSPWPLTPHDTRHVNTNTLCVPRPCAGVNRSQQEGGL